MNAEMQGLFSPRYMAENARSEHQHCSSPSHERQQRSNRPDKESIDKSKHFDGWPNFVQEKVEESMVAKVSSQENTADNLTKPLSTVAFKYLRNKSDLSKRRIWFCGVFCYSMAFLRVRSGGYRPYLILRQT